MKVIETKLKGVLLLEPRVFGDDRGFFLESYNKKQHCDSGIAVDFVQDNHSRSQRGVLRGLHYQRHQGKLVTVVHGEVFDVAVDIRPDSATFGAWYGTTLSDSNHQQLFIPPGFAHGFAVLSETADVLYKTTDYYRPTEEGGILWNDPDLAIDWPIDEPILSARDQQNPQFKDIDRDRLITLKARN